MKIYDTCNDEHRFDANRKRFVITGHHLRRVPDFINIWLW